MDHPRTAQNGPPKQSRRALSGATGGITAVEPSLALNQRAGEFDRDQITPGRVLESTLTSDTTTMIWLFERGDRIARLTTRFDTTSGEYVLEMEWSDGLATTERFTDFGGFQARILTLERQLVSEEWRQSSGSPQLIAADWWKP
jgi:hypothetical protein